MLLFTDLNIIIFPVVELLIDIGPELTIDGTLIVVAVKLVIDKDEYDDGKLIVKVLLLIVPEPDGKTTQIFNKGTLLIKFVE